MSAGKQKRLSESFIIGVVALIFLMIGYQTALFVHNAAVLKIAAGRDEPDTVYVYAGSEAVSDHGGLDMSEEGTGTIRKNAYHSPRAEAVRKNIPYRRVESFRFDPNTVSTDDLCRLGFTRKQAESIDNYRKKGGRFHRSSDFSKSFVVSDSIFRRLEPFIDIPLLDLNVADSAALDALPGIGGWFAMKIIEHRKALGGYSYKEQLMDIYRFDREKYDGLSDLVTIGKDNVTPYPLWKLSADSLRLHPYISDYETAKAVVLFRENNDKEQWTIENLAEAGVLSEVNAEKMSGCTIAHPDI